LIFLQGHNKHQRRAVGLALLDTDAERINPIDIMKIICPSLGLKEEASTQSVAEIVPQLSDKKDPFVILEKDEMTYMQAL